MRDQPTRKESVQARRSFRMFKRAQGLKARAVMHKDIGEIAEAAIIAHEVMTGAQLLPKKDGPNDKRPDDLIVHKVARAMAAGLTKNLACAHAGISPSTLDMWMRKGENGDAKFIQAWRTIGAAESEAAVAMLDVVGGAATGASTYDGTVQDWKAAAWMLERRFPREYGRTVQETEHAVRAETEEDKALLDKLLGKT